MDIYFILWLRIQYSHYLLLKLFQFGSLRVPGWPEGASLVASWHIPFLFKHLLIFWPHTCLELIWHFPSSKSGINHLLLHEIHPHVCESCSQSPLRFSHHILVKVLAPVSKELACLDRAITTQPKIAPDSAWELMDVLSKMGRDWLTPISFGSLYHLARSVLESGQRRNWWLWSNSSFCQPGEPETRDQNSVLIFLKIVLQETGFRRAWS